VKKVQQWKSNWNAFRFPIISWNKRKKEEESRMMGVPWKIFEQVVTHLVSSHWPHKIKRYKIRVNRSMLHYVKLILDCSNNSVKRISLLNHLQEIINNNQRSYRIYYLKYQLLTREQPWPKIQSKMSMSW